MPHAVLLLRVFCCGSRTPKAPETTITKDRRICYAIPRVEPIPDNTIAYLRKLAVIEAMAPAAVAEETVPLSAEDVSSHATISHSRPIANCSS